MFRPCLIFLTIVVTWALDCNTPVGIEDGTLEDSRMTANSNINKWHAAKEGRLNNYKGKPGNSGVGAWCADKRDSNQYRYIQFDLGTVRKIGKIATQGRNTSSYQYVSSYRILHSNLGTIFEGILDINHNEVIFAGNVDQNSIVTHDIPSTGRIIEARYIRVVPVEYRANICMRFELYECVEPVPATTAAPPAPATTEPPVVCPDGYRLGADNKTCEDIDECAEQSSKCNHYCHNTKGGYDCSCKQGFKLDVDQRTCIDINECLVNKGGCSQQCENTEGTFNCRCNVGYRLQSDGKTCKDIDECAEKIDLCTQNCENTEGSYTCSCNAGYRLASDKYTCKNIDECNEGTSGCNQICTDTLGSFKCSCRAGYKLKTDMKTCEDIDECQASNGGCSDTCQNLVGSYICTCPSGYQLDGTGKNCIDKNECALANGGCQHTCNNSLGSFLCSCNDGYKLNSDGLTCSDIDECTDGSAQCDPKSTTCSNLIPGYECKCKKGYLVISNDKNKCKAPTCPALLQSVGTTVSPQTCLQDQVMEAGDLCKFGCAIGFELPDHEDTLLCLPTGSWNASVINCKRVSCPKLVAPANGKLNPDTCVTEGNVYQRKCGYVCNSGYTLSGVQIKTCLSNGQWDSQEEPTCTQSYPDPFITCPDNVHVTLSPGANEADVSALLQDPQSNQPPSRITITPAEYFKEKMFPAGTTTLTYVATNEVGKTAQCQTLVIVLDSEPPKTDSCPDAIYETTTGNSKVISWNPPKFIDNVAVVNVVSTKNPGETFNTGSTNVIYTATDAAKNRGTCTFTVHLKKIGCIQPEDPDNGALVCQFGSFCTIKCNQNKKLFKNTFFISCSSSTLEWSEIPDCVDHVNPAADGSCPIGFVKQGSINGAFTENICVKCPRGYSYNSNDKTCEPCQIGYISTSEGSMQCHACLNNTSTLEVGSKYCTALCYAGQFSKSGFDLKADLEPCEPCPISSYQSQAGQKSCEKCPNGTTTISSGSASVDSCGGLPVITRYEPNPTNATERYSTQFECYGHGLPLPYFKITKVKPAPDGFGGPFTQEYIKGPDGNQIGIRHIISKVTEHDAGAYECKVENKFGTDQKYLSLNVELNFDVGKRRRRRRQQILKAAR
ncbi:sushi, von Willebrand factor type A, EGF and pentraxin domain-containing protein 1-like [Stylophora pistillata]|uniref:Multiple epidermal growth factor-like domains protein 6 n=1 Tax=Stylophora pistillata TaxID=50429 RepID=A0A2B4RGT2_STYPI|nr:sushi, von Willebrand factor type A, EGF and pentraxin domain-containing protein 1-like [Stylophora pistillata]PFX17584.1 Multiple epidermal growth factor-like domains protein 6 [Stylophora pistillata]